MKRVLALMVPALATLAAVMTSTATTGCGSGPCCLAICGDHVTVELRGPGGTFLSEFDGTYTIDGDAPVPVSCTSATNTEPSCVRFEFAGLTPPELRIDIVSSSANAAFHGIVGVEYIEEEVCCDTCDIGSASAELIATP